MLVEDLYDMTDLLLESEVMWLRLVLKVAALLLSEECLPPLAFGIGGVGVVIDVVVNGECSYGRIGTWGEALRKYCSGKN